MENAVITNSNEITRSNTTKNSVTINQAQKDYCDQHGIGDFYCLNEKK